MSNSPSPGSSSNLPQWIILLLTAIGVPSAVYFTFAQLIAQHLWVALGLLFIYEIAILPPVAFMKIVWQKEFENDFAKKFANRIRSMREYPFGYQRYYLNHLSKVHGSVEKLGVQIASPPKLKEIFVEPTVVPEPSDQVSPNPLEPPEGSHSDEKSIWDYLASDSLLILGAVGIGKSTLLQHIALTLVDRKKRLKLGVSYKVPFLLFLDQLGKELKRNEDLSLTNAIETAIKSGWRQPPSEWIERRLQKGRCVILLDGLDEVADSNNRQQLIAWINKQINIFDMNRFIITSRPLSYRNNPLEKVTSLKIQGFSDEQIYEFVDKWYQATKRDSTGAGELKKQLQLSKEKTDLLKLARNPLLLGMIIVVYQFGPLPEKRIDLYERIFNIYLGERPHVGERWRWKESSHAKRELLPKEEKQKILQLLAYKMMERGIREIESTDAEELIKASFRKMPITVEQFLQNAPHNGILEQLRLSYRFTHRSFQEYLAAMYAKDIQQPELLVKHINPRELSQWRETIVLYCSKAEPTPIMSACLKGYSLLEDTLDLALALYLEPEVQKNVVQWVKVKPAIHEVRKRFERAVMLATEDEDPDVRHKIAKALLAHRKQSLNPDDETPTQKSTDTSLIKCAEYQLFLDLTESHNARHPDHLISFPAGQGLSPVLGVRRSDAIAFCDWLTEQESGDWHYRVPTSKETKNISIRNPGIGYWIKDGKEFVWSQSGPISSNSISLEQLNRSSIQDSYNAPNTPPKTEHHRFLAGLIPIVDKLRQANNLHHDLVELLTSIRKIILNHKGKLEVESQYANNDKANLQNKFKEASAQQTALRRDLKEIASRQLQLREAVEEKKNLQKQLNEIDIKELSKKLTTLQHTRLTLSNKLARTLKHQQRSKLQEQINNIDKEIEDSKKEQDSKQNKKKELEKRLVGASEQISILEKQLENADEEEKELEKQIKEASVQVSILRKHLEEADREVVEAKQRVASFSTHANEFYSIYEGFSIFKSTYSDALLTNTLKRNQILNLDRILVGEDNEKTLHDACTRVNDFIKSYTQRLAESGAAFPNINHSIKSDIDRALTIARELARQFNQITLDEDFQKLDYYLNWYLPQLAQNRSFVREDSLLRLYIRYFANTLAQHLSYWLPKDSYLRSDQLSQLESMVQHIVETYFDVYVAFALLEERIRGNLSASEGILIVRESRRKSHEIIELKENKP